MTQKKLQIISKSSDKRKKTALDKKRNRPKGYCSIPLEKRIEAGWQPGKSGNPNGRPPTAKCIPEILRRIGDEIAPEKLVAITEKIIGEKLPRPINNRDLMLKRAHYDADLGDEKAREFIAERTEGKIRTSLEITEPDRARNTFRFEIIEKANDKDQQAASTIPAK